MTRLFDASGSSRKDPENETKAEDLMRAVTEAANLEAATGALNARLGKAPSVRGIKYTAVRQPGSRWGIEHAEDGEDFIFQCFPLRDIVRPWSDIIPLMIAALDSIFPRNYQISYIPPSDKMEITIKFYTIKIKGIVGQPGWERAVKERALNALFAINAWY
jgi:hypothetical protein